MSGHFRWGGWALCKVCLVICSTHHLFNLLAALWAAKMLICLAMGECFENGEMEVITLSTRQIKYFAYPHANIRTITIEYLPVFQLPAWFLDTVLYSSRWSAMWHLWAPPYPTFGSNSTAGCRKRLSTSYRSCPHSGILTKIPQEHLCHVGRSCQTLSHGPFPTPSAWFRNIPCTGALVLPNPPLLHPSPQSDRNGHQWSALLESLV